MEPGGAQFLTAVTMTGLQALVQGRKSRLLAKDE